MLRILLVSVAIEGGGAEQAVVDLATGLAAGGHQVAVAFLEGGDTRLPALRGAGIECHRLLSRREFAKSALADFTPSCIGRLRGVVRGFGPEVIHTHVPRATLWTALAKRLFRLRVPLVYTEHSMQDVYPSWGRWVYRTFLPATDHVVAVSEAANASFRERWQRGGGKVTTIWNGIATGRLGASASREAVRLARGCAADTPVVCNVANLTAPKAHDVLIAAISQVCERLPSARCWVAGSSEIDYAAAERTRQCLALHGADEYVQLLGVRSDVPDLLGACDVFALSSRQEGFPITILEAMAAGKPVVTTDVGGCAEAVVDGETGLVVPPENPEALAKALEDLLTRPAEARRMGEAGRRRVEEHFTVEAMVGKHIALYGRLVQHSANRRLLSGA